MNFKNIHIGELICQKVKEDKIEISRICNFMKTSEDHISEMYKCESLDSNLILKWSKLLEYDFFRVYSHHLILYAPPSKDFKNKAKEPTSLPQFRKNIYTQEIIDFIIERILKEEMTKKDVMQKYKIPKTTLYKWLKKYSP